MNNKQKIIAVLYIAFLIGCFVLALNYLWPVFLVLGIVIAYRVHQTRKIMKQAEKEAREYQESINRLYEDPTSFHDDMFYEQVHRTQQQTPDVIDAEYEEHEVKDND